MTHCHPACTIALQRKQMPIREYHESDLAALRAIHAAQGFDYALPNLSNPLFLTKLVLTDTAHAAGNSPVSHTPAPSSEHAPHNEKILGAAFLPLTAEAYLLLDPASGSPRDRW